MVRLFLLGLHDPEAGRFLSRVEYSIKKKKVRRLRLNSPYLPEGHILKS